jgi:hypothetical protein
MANVHVIPANRQIAKELRRIKRGDSIQLRGKLVDIYEKGHLTRSTSLSRDDRGGGACEILLVEQVIRSTR